jgi:YVTN family beta-propeller protein
VYVALGRANAVAVVDARTSTEVGSIPVGQRVWGIGLTADGRKLYTANGLSNDVSVIDIRTRRVVATLKAGDGPWGVAVTRD